MAVWFDAIGVAGSRSVSRALPYRSRLIKRTRATSGHHRAAAYRRQGCGRPPGGWGRPLLARCGGGGAGEAKFRASIRRVALPVLLQLARSCADVAHGNHSVRPESYSRKSSLRIDGSGSRPTTECPAMTSLGPTVTRGPNP